ncbi:hypothetical protein ABZ920_17105 [Streptomyces sp. NPDC046831]|uniref:hypothetical protein n=1 Tax=Streptomyces sp. NPDC046831 TaxID=3154805 RepID=UPI0033C0AF40
MLALRLTRLARPAVQLRRLTVCAASAGTGFLLLCALGYALAHPAMPAAAVLRLCWCAVPLAATVYLAVAVARTDPGTRPRPGLSAVGLGPGRLLAVSAATTALSCGFGSVAALIAFLRLRGDLGGGPLTGTSAEFLAPGGPLPVPAMLTLLCLVPAAASLAVAVALRPRDPRPPAATRAAGRGYGRFGAYPRTGARETFGAYGRFGARWKAVARPEPSDGPDGGAGRPAPRTAGARAAAGAGDRQGAATSRVPGHPAGARAAAGALATAEERPDPRTGPGQERDGLDPDRPPAPRKTPGGLPWGIAVLAAGLAAEAYASRTAPASSPALPGGLAVGSAAVLVGWLLTAVGLALAGPGLTHLCGRVLQSVGPGALRLLAGRVLMEEAGRIGRPLGLLCAVASGTYAMLTLSGGAPDVGPLTSLGTLLVAGCALATLLTTAVEARQARAETVAALLRLGAPATMLLAAAALRVTAVLVLFTPLTLAVAHLAALPLTG